MGERLINLHGFEELNNALKRAQERAPESTGKAMQNLFERGKANAQNFAPVDTWFMHNHIDTFYEPGSTDTLFAYLESPAYYSGFVNYGTINMNAQPFFSDAVEIMRQQGEELFADVADGLLR